MIPRGRKPDSTNRRDNRRISARGHAIIAVAVVLMLASSRLPGQSRVIDTKHNLTVTGPGIFKATAEKGVCQFCHTAHSPSESVQLWNHKLSTVNYELYSSDYLTHLKYSMPNQPNQRSKFCLSCHDGTVAIGAVYNNKGSTTITMANGVTSIPPGSSSYLGISLRADHPVGYIYDNSRDPELVNRGWPWNTAIKLDPDASNGTVECITCHDPHDNTNAKFLRMPNTNAALCTFCHSKANWSDAIHKTSTQPYITQPDSIQTTVGEWACRDCHKSHNGEGIPYLLNKSEEQTCFTVGCHGSSATGVNTKDVQSEYLKQYRHPTTDVSGKHLDPDNQTSLNVPNRHAECADCHNSHQGKKGLHPVQSNLVSNVLTGTRGVIPLTASDWTQPTSFTDIAMATQENQICFKCHSYYALGLLPNGVSTIRGPSGDNITDQAMEFNPANKSAHPVQVNSNGQTGSLSPKALDLTQLNATWNMPGAQTMYCSDCHGNDQQTSQSVPQGPHGSNRKFMLAGTGMYWPKNAFNDSLWSLADIVNNRNNWQHDLFCVNCHQMTNGLSFANNVHNSLNHQSSDVKCITCHVTVPHGSKRSRLIGYASDVQPYNYLGPGQFEKLVIVGFQKAIGPTSYLVNNCSMNGVCHGSQTGFYEP
jgi:predicted CXXCH cytochrome family protein